MYKNYKVVVTMTSWSKRIGNCAQVVKRVLSNTVKPDIVFLNLSEAEFPQREGELPSDLVQLTKNDQAFKINWVPGPNTKTMKKVFPILPLLDDDDIIIYMDDDFMLPEGFVKSRVDDFIEHGCKHAISAWLGTMKSSMLANITGFPLQNSSQPSSLVTKRMLSGYEVFYNNPDVCYRSADDSLYTLLVTLNGFTYVPCKDYGLSQSGKCVHPIKNDFNTVSPLKTMGVFKKNGYSQQNTYITHLLYLSIVRDSDVPAWNQETKKRLQKFSRLAKFEDDEFFSQVDDFKTIDIPISEKQLSYWYWSGKLNAGDYYNQYLMCKLYWCRLKLENDIESKTDICLCGSILLNEHMSNCRRVVGCGIQNRMHSENLPKDSSYVALRGPTTLQFVKQHRNPANKNVFMCDPGLLLSRIYRPTNPIGKVHKVGIVPHYVDEERVRELYGSKYHVISMQTNDIEALARDILSCEVVLSSSLHGIIFAHSYGVPAYHVQFTDFFKNGNFKFADYYMSFQGVKYHKFMCKDYKMDVQKILEYHSKNGSASNPTMEMVLEKQRRFMEVLPYKQYLRKEFRQELGLNCADLEELSYGAGSTKHVPNWKAEVRNWKFAEFMNG